MKKVLILACAALTACTNDIDLGTNKEQVETLSNAIGFQMAKKNMTTTKGTETALNVAGHYNFGVWGYKAHTGVGQPLIMENYLVGYMDETYHKGYHMTADKQTTLGDASNSKDGQSQWAYEMLGSSEYNHMTDDGYYKNDQTAYMSNIANQYLRYWDLSAPTTNFYAYAPYVNKNATSTEVTFDNNTKTMTFPDGSIEAGYNPTDNEYMYTAKQVKSADYGKDVSLVFKRLNSKINIKFYENIEGYNVQILNLSDTYNKGVYAKPAKRTGTAGAYTYTAGKLMTKTGVTITFDETTLDGTPSNWQTTVSNKSDKSLKFTAPADKIGETKDAATPSTTTYYAIPKKAIASESTAADDLKEVGFTFHVSYKLISTTGEEIKVNDATVFVPAENCAWECNKAYTYIFKITKNSNGSTGNVTVPDPDGTGGVTPGEEAALYPIVFDGCTVVDYEDAPATDHVITDGTFNYYLTLSASTLSKTGSPITVNAYKTDGTTDTFATISDLTITNASGDDKKSDFDFTITTGAAPKIAAKTAASSGETYTLKYTISGTKMLEAKFTVTD